MVERYTLKNQGQTAITVQQRQRREEHPPMKRMTPLFLFIIAVSMSGCEFGDVATTTDESYDDMVSKYTLLTVSELWTAFGNDEDYNGSYLLVQGVLLSVGTNSVTLMDADTQKAVKCDFDTSIDLTDLENVLDNNVNTDDEDTVTVGGVCHYYEDTTSYPYLESCDYFYVNNDA